MTFLFVKTNTKEEEARYPENDHAFSSQNIGESGKYEEVVSCICFSIFSFDI